MLDEPDVPLLTFINAVRFSYCIKQACFRVVGINRVPGAIKKCFPQLRRVFLFVFFLYLFIYFFNKQESTDVSVSSWPVSTQSWERGGSESIICVSL